MGKMSTHVKSMQGNACNTLPLIMTDVSSWYASTNLFCDCTFSHCFSSLTVLTVLDKDRWLFTAELGACTFIVYTTMNKPVKKPLLPFTEMQNWKHKPLGDLNNTWSHIKTNLQMFKVKMCFSNSLFCAWWLFILHLLNNSGLNPNSLKTFSLNSCNIKWHKR